MPPWKVTHTKKLTSIRDLAKAAVFAASDEGSAITGTILNLTAGLVVHEAKKTLQCRGIFSLNQIAIGSYQKIRP